MAPVRNIYNLITDAFCNLRYQEHKEENYRVDVVFSDTIIPSYEITIKSRDPNITNYAFLHLMLNNRDELIDYDDMNTLFRHSNWIIFCSVFDNEIPDDLEDEFIDN